jgi:rod shape-determining protein MreC
MPAKRFDQARPFVTLVIVGVAWLVLPVGIKTFSRASFFELTAPITATASHNRDLQEYWSLRAHSNRDLIEAGRDLARVNASYELTTQQNSDLQSEIDELETESRLPPLPQYRLEPARVALRDFSGWWQRMVIRKGSNYGIPLDAPVVFTGGVVGRISEVDAYTSVVELISSPGVRLAALVDGDTRPVSYRGGVNPTFGPAQGVIEFVPLDIFARPNSPRRLITSGLGGVFPAGLTLGQVISVDASTDGLFKTGRVALDPRLSELTEVTVLVPIPVAPPAAPPPASAPASE